LGVRATLGLKNYFEPTAPEGLWWGVFGNLGLGADWGPEKDWGVSVSQESLRKLVLEPPKSEM